MYGHNLCPTDINTITDGFLSMTMRHQQLSEQRKNWSNLDVLQISSTRPQGEADFKLLHQQKDEKKNNTAKVLQSMIQSPKSKPCYC